MSVDAVLATHTAMRQGLEANTLSAARRVMSRDVDWFNLRDSWETTSEVSGLVDSAVRQEAAFTQAFQTRMYGELGVAADEPSLSIDGSLRTGTSSPVAYRRAGADVRRHLVDGAPLDVAVDRAFERVMEMVADDLSLAMREQSRRFFMANRRTTLGFRRVVRPELSTTGTCGLCLVASDNRYSRSDLLPLHTRCRCDVMPITRDYDPVELNNVDLEALYEAAGSKQAGDLLNVKVLTEAHGELGPRIVDAAHPGNTPFKSHLRNRIPAREQKMQEILSNAERDILDIESRISAGVATDTDRTRLQQERGQAEEARTFLSSLYEGRENIRTRRLAA